MIDGNKWNACGNRNRLGRHGADQHTADQTWSGGCCNTIQIGKSDPGFLHGFGNDPVDVFKMRPCRNFGNDTAKRPVIIDLRQHDVRADAPCVINNSGCRLVTTGFNTQNNHVKALSLGGAGLYSRALPRPRAVTPEQIEVRYSMITDPNHIIIGTRSSPLAMIQTHLVADLLRLAHPALAGQGTLVIDAVKTTGDQVLDRALSEIGGKGLFTKELDRALLDRRIDIAVHSMKDLETWLPDGMAIGCILPRADPRDAFISLKVPSLHSLAKGARVGTASLRRKAQLLHLRPDLDVDVIRGNVQTRLGKLEAGEFDATFLALAGLDRLGRRDVATEILEPDVFLPSCAQGAIGVTCRADDSRILEYLQALDHQPSNITVMCERAMLDALDGSCRTPIAGLAEIDGDDIRLRGLIARPDGSEVLMTERRGAAADAIRLGKDAGEELRSRAGPGFFDEAS